MFTVAAPRATSIIVPCTHSTLSRPQHQNWTINELCYVHVGVCLWFNVGLAAREFSRVKLLWLVKSQIKIETRERDLKKKA